MLDDEGDETCIALASSFKLRLLCSRTTIKAVNCGMVKSEPGPFKKP